MSFNPDELCICIPTRRPPPVLTVESYLRNTQLPILIIVDPEMIAAHQEWHFDQWGAPSNIRLITGSRGMGAQSFNCYKSAAMLGYEKFFRMDDDLPLKTFVHKEGYYPEIEEVIGAAEACMEVLQVSLVGFANTSNRHWMGVGFKKTHGHIHGGANLSISSHNPRAFIDPELKRCEDIYRTCAHRRHSRDGKNGRVNFIGFDKSLSSSKQGGNVSTIQLTKEEIEEQRRKVLAEFGDMISQLDDDGLRYRR